MAGEVIVDYKKALEKMKKAKTAKEMVESWEALMLPGSGAVATMFGNIFEVYCKEAPAIIKYYTHDPLVYIMENGALDPKTRELVLIAVLAALQNGPAVTGHIGMAIGQGATKAEIMDVIHCALYEFGKAGAGELGPAVAEGFRLASESQSNNP